MKCVHCGKCKDSSFFYNDKSKPSGKKPRCKECDKLSRNVEKRRAYEKEYWSHPDRIEKRRKQSRDTMKRHAERYAKRRKEYLKTDEGSAMYRRYTQKRYALRKAAFVEDVCPMQLYEDQGGVCYLCKGTFDFKSMELDHVKATAKGGKHEKKNCKMACRRCNRSKGSKSLEELSYQMG